MAGCSADRAPALDSVLHLDDVLAQEAARLAADLRLRGADAVYLSVAAPRDLPVITWDMQMIRRAPLSVRVQTP